MVDERPQMAASEIEQELLAELQKLPTLHDTQSVTIRPYSGPKSWTWELDSIEPEVGPEQSKFADRGHERPRLHTVGLSRPQQADGRRTAFRARRPLPVAANRAGVELKPSPRVKAGALGLEPG